MLRFFLIWLGQVFAGCGSMIATFCLGIWLYRGSESVTQFSLLIFFHTLPVVVLAGIAGRAADRWDRRKVMLISDGANALVALALLALFRADAATPALVYLLALAGGCLGAFQWPAYRSWSTQQVAARHYGRLGGLMKLGEGIPYLLGPALGGLLMTRTSLVTVFALSMAAYLVSVAILFAVGGKGASLQVAHGEKGPAAGGWGPLLAFLRVRPGLIGLLFLTPFIVFTEGWVMTLFQPYMLYHLDPGRMGLMLSLGGTGMVAGGIVMGFWGGPRRQIFSVMGCILVQTVTIAYLASVTPGFWTGTAAAFLYFAAIPLLSGSNQAIWQTRTPDALQGRMFAFRRATESVATPASLLSAGLLVDFVFKPLLASGGALPAWLDHIVTDGPGRGIAGLFLTVAVLNIATLAAALAYRPVRRVDLEEPVAAAGTGVRAAAPPAEVVAAGQGRSA